MTIAVGDVVHIDQVFRVSGVNCVIGADYELENEGTATTDLELVSELINDNWTPSFITGVWQPANSDQLEATCLKVKKILPIIEDDFIFIQNISGGLPIDHYPAHAAAMITKTGKAGGPGSSGRSFLPAPPTAHFTQGRLNSISQTLWDNVASFFNDILILGAFGTQWAPQHVQAGGVHTDVFRTWVNPNLRTVLSRQAVDCPV